MAISRVESKRIWATGMRVAALFLVENLSQDAEEVDLAPDLGWRSASALR